MRVIRSKKLSFFVFLAIFVLLLLCNFLTEKIADDFAYMFSWKTGEKITEILQIFPSMLAHGKTMNGRLVAHFFVQLFDMLPKPLFNAVNAAVFTVMIAAMYKIGKTEKENNLLLICLFCSVWLFVPVFGQVFLWLDGACNYLWSITVCLIFIIPFLNDFLYNKKITNVFLKIVFIPFSLIAGAFSENASAAVLFMAGLTVLAMIFIQHKKFPIYYVSCIGTAFLGYLSMIFTPAEHLNKGIQLSPAVLRTNCINALDMYMSLKIPLVAFSVLFVLAFTAKVKRERLIASLIFILGSLCSDFLMVAASYFPERCLMPSVIFLLVGNGILFAEVFESKQQIKTVCATAVLLLFTAYYVIVGLNDIYVTNSAIKANEAYIYECKARGEKDITVPMIDVGTKYSAAYGSKYLDAETQDTWPNDAISKYYGINSIIGKW